VSRLEIDIMWSGVKKDVFVGPPKAVYDMLHPRVVIIECQDGSPLADDILDFLTKDPKVPVLLLGAPSVVDQVQSEIQQRMPRRGQPTLDTLIFLPDGQPFMDRPHRVLSATLSARWVALSFPGKPRQPCLVSHLGFRPSLLRYLLNLLDVEVSRGSPPMLLLSHRNRSVASLVNLIASINISFRDWSCSVGPQWEVPDVDMFQVELNKSIETQGPLFSREQFDREATLLHSLTTLTSDSITMKSKEEIQADRLRKREALKEEMQDAKRQKVEERKAQQGRPRYVPETSPDEEQQQEEAHRSQLAGAIRGQSNPLVAGSILVPHRQVNPPRQAFRPPRPAPTPAAGVQRQAQLERQAAELEQSQASAMSTGSQSHKGTKPKPKRAPVADPEPPVVDPPAVGSQSSGQGAARVPAVLQSLNLQLEE